jgi:phosphatidylinositol-3-phosphatase
LRSARRLRFALSGAVGAVLLGTRLASAEPAPIPRYEHIFVIVEENRTADEIIGNPGAPNINRLATAYGNATNFYAESHPSEPNYIAMVGGDTFGIHDDDSIICKPRNPSADCKDSDEDGYVDHTIAAPNLAQQLDAHGLSWKGYFESLPESGSLIYHYPSPTTPVPGQPNALYASKHNGFVTFKSVQDDPERAKKIVGFDALARDIAGGTLPNYAIIVPNQCNDMHGIGGANSPDDCKNKPGLVARGDKFAGALVARIMASRAWTGKGNTAIVITFDEDDDHIGNDHPDGCCGFGDKNNPGGGWIPTVVITNHGPRGLADPTPYNHYSLLRTTEAAFGITDYLGHAADKDKGVVVMAPLFQVKGK